MDALIQKPFRSGSLSIAPEDVPASGPSTVPAVSQTCLVPSPPHAGHGPTCWGCDGQRAGPGLTTEAGCSLRSCYLHCPFNGMLSKACCLEICADFCISPKSIHF